MKKRSRYFWAFFILWSLINLSLLVMAVYDVFGPFNKTTVEFWPFTVGSLRYYDFLELLIYLGIPLIIFYLTKFVQTHYPSFQNKTEKKSKCK